MYIMHVRSWVHVNSQRWPISAKVVSDGRTTDRGRSCSPSHGNWVVTHLGIRIKPMAVASLVLTAPFFFFPIF